MEQIVYQMGAAEASGPPPRRARAEGEIGGEIEVGYEAEHVACRVGHVFVERGISPQGIVDAVVERGGEASDQGEAEKFDEGAAHGSGR